MLGDVDLSNYCCYLSLSGHFSVDLNYLTIPSALKCGCDNMLVFFFSLTHALPYFEHQTH